MNKNLVVTFLFSLTIFISSGDIVVTHTPVSLPVMLREPATVSCNPSQSLQHSDGYTDQQKPGQPPQLLMYRASSLFSRVPGSGTDFTPKISSVEAEDVAVYYCQQSTQVPPT
uniref:Immunoglobulin V-set domain-containing protein n=1 Tax=Loxodonta africana TaxID=9785 RepID=G3TTX9_LOXAF